MDGARQISSVPRGLVSPVDGSITSLGRITEDADRVEQVTGVNYDKVSQPDFKSRFFPHFFAFTMCLEDFLCGQILYYSEIYSIII